MSSLLTSPSCAKLTLEGSQLQVKATEQAFEGSEQHVACVTYKCERIRALQIR